MPKSEDEARQSKKLMQAESSADELAKTMDKMGGSEKDSGKLVNNTQAQA